jgi:N-hydroxyarylamine O-acetyltransferase
MSSVLAITANEPRLSPELVERVLAKLGFERRPSVDLEGLNEVYGAICSRIPFDNAQKRIWFASDRQKPATGSDPVEFFENWLKHGTGGTCWPTNGGMYALASALGFHARRTAGSVIVPDYPQGANHGSVLVEIDGVEYVFDLPFGAFKALPLVPGETASTETGIHNLRAVPRDDGGFDMYWHLGWAPMEIPYRSEPEHDPVDHAFFLKRYEIANRVGYFNTTLLAMRRFADSIITLGRGKKLVNTENGIETVEIATAQRKAVLIEEFGFSEEVVVMIPPDEEGGVTAF